MSRAADSGHGAEDTAAMPSISGEDPKGRGVLGWHRLLDWRPRSALSRVLIVFFLVAPIIVADVFVNRAYLVGALNVAVAMVVLRHVDAPRRLVTAGAAAVVVLMALFCGAGHLERGIDAVRAFDQVLTLYDGSGTEI